MSKKKKVTNEITKPKRKIHFLFLVCSIISIFAGVGSLVYGIMLNNDLERALETGLSTPGADYVNFGFIVLIVGVILLGLFLLFSPKNAYDESLGKKELKTEKAKKRGFVRAFVITFVIGLISFVSLIPLMTSVRFGLDLQGGFEILYRVSSIDETPVDYAMMQTTYRSVLRRVDILGVSEPEITIEGENLRIQLAGVTDENEAKAVLSSMATLTFRDSQDNLVMTSNVLRPNGVSVAPDDRNIGSYHLVLQIADVDVFFRETQIIREANEVMVIWLDFEEGVNSFADEADCNADGNSRCISSASINFTSPTNVVTLSGNFTNHQATTLADLINSGSLPAQLNELSSRTVDASFGADALQTTFIAGIIGIVLIIVSMIAIYRFSGVVVSICLIVYTALVFLVFNMIGGRLTLPGIAAVVIGIGMAIDAAVICFARIKEELRESNNLPEAFEKGKKFSFTSIIDAKLTSLLVAIVLFIFGESSVKGFATMLIIGLFAGMIIMVYLLRFLLNMFVKSGKFNNNYKAFIGIRNLDKKMGLERFNYGKYMFKFAVTMIAVVLIGIGFFTQRGLNLGIDFSGGSSIYIRSSETLTVEDVSNDIESLGYTITNINNIDNYTVYVTVSDVFIAEDNERVETHFHEHYADITTNIGAVSTIVQRQLVENAFRALLFACIGLIIYITIRFTFNFGVATIFGLIHDSLMVVILFSIFALEVNSIFIAAILSVIGYSINDTIVVFDRIRENKKKLYENNLKTKDELKELINTSVKETVVRNLITSSTTIIPVIALIFLGSHEILNFNYALLIGFIAGAYSSLFISTQVYYMLEARNIGKPQKKKWYEAELDEKEEHKVKGVNC